MMGSCVFSRVKKARLGVSLLEILISLAIFSFAVLSILGGLPIAAKQHRGSVFANRALYLAQGKMDGLLADDGVIPTVVQSDHPVSGDNSIVREWWAESLTSDPDVQQVNVRVTWVESDGRTRQILLRSGLTR
jgi:type II secretory pathway pseudopilin PulG